MELFLNLKKNYETYRYCTVNIHTAFSPNPLTALSSNVVERPSFAA